MYEIERRFLVTDLRAALTWTEEIRLDVAAMHRIEQAYLFANDEIAMRVRKVAASSKAEPSRAWLTIKISTERSPLIREEFNHSISVALAEQQIAKCPHRIVKTRHRIIRLGGDETWEVDVFEGENEGLLIAEIELREADQLIVVPPWVGAEVTDDPRYSNAALSRHPFKHWS